MIRFDRVPVTCSYRCLSCSMRFTTPYPTPITCPQCKGPQVKWLNYEQVTDLLQSKQ